LHPKEEKRLHAVGRPLRHREEVRITDRKEHSGGTRRKAFARRLTTLFFPLLAFGCGGSGGASDQGTPLPPAALQITLDRDRVISGSMNQRASPVIIKKTDPMGGPVATLD
jgi:hypothetical protein